MFWILSAFVLGVGLEYLASRRQIERLRSKADELALVVEAQEGMIAEAGLALTALEDRHKDTAGIIRERFREVLSILERMGKFIKVANIIYAFGGKAKRWPERKEAAFTEIMRRFGGKLPKHAAA